MKKQKITLCIALFVFAFTVSQAQDIPAQDSTGLPGDNFSLQGALGMFQKANSVEEFEKLINAEDNNVNNLDLNGDGEIDYIRVINKKEKNAHAFVLQAAISGTENQDIAVVELEKTGDTTAILQIVGDEDIYGEQTIVEPGEGEDDEVEETNYPQSGPSSDYTKHYTYKPRFIVNVWFWPAVRFVYAPAYIVYRSPWGWRHHPNWYRPWRPFYWHAWHPLSYRHYHHCAVVRTHRVVYAHSIYRPYRTTSVVVRNRHQATVNNYRVTRSTKRTVVTGPRGNKAVATKKTTTVRGPGGNVKGRKTTTTVRRKR
jgi:hypothetical protein